MNQIMKLKLLLLFCVAAISVNAQPPSAEGPMEPPPEMTAGNTNEVTEITRMQVEWMKKKLKLNNDHVQSVKMIIEEHTKKILTLRKKENENKNTAHAKQLADLERDIALKKILNDKQYHRFEKNKQVLENSFENNSGEGIPPPPPMN